MNARDGGPARRHPHTRHDAASVQPDLPERHAPLFKVGQSISGFAPVGGNQAALMADSNAAIDAMVADIDAATDHVHLLFYIWLPDSNGREDGRGAEARRRARRHLPRDGRRSRLAPADQVAALGRDGARPACGWPRALPIGNPLLRASTGGSTCATTARSW